MPKKRKIIIPSILDKFGSKTNDSLLSSQANSFKGMRHTAHFKLKNTVESTVKNNDKLQKFKILMED